MQSQARRTKRFEKGVRNRQPPFSLDCPIGGVRFSKTPWKAWRCPQLLVSKLVALCPTAGIRWLKVTLRSRTWEIGTTDNETILDFKVTSQAWWPRLATARTENGYQALSSGNHTNPSWTLHITDHLKSSILQIRLDVLLWIFLKLFPSPFP